MRSLAETVTYTQPSDDKVYDNDTDSYIDASPTVVKVQAFFTSFREKEVDNLNVRPLDQRCTIERSKLQLEPVPGDTITRADGDWKVLQVRREPSESLWILHIRKP